MHVVERAAGLSLQNRGIFGGRKSGSRRKLVFLYVAGAAPAGGGEAFI